MSGIEKTAKTVFAVIVGAVLYSILNWIPLLGAAAAGAYTGYGSGGGFRRGFRNAAYAATIGGLLVICLAYVYALTDLTGANKTLIMFVGWVLLVWHIAGVLIAGLAGGLGAVGNDINKLIPTGLREVITKPRKKSAVDYAICPGCGQGNVVSAKTCIGCGIGLP
ncbi:MAG: DUF5518 domain-containing protein [Candidatus Altiarchaeota archaeon]